MIGHSLRHNLQHIILSVSQSGYTLCRYGDHLHGAPEYNFHRILLRGVLQHSDLSLMCRAASVLEDLASRHNPTFPDRDLDRHFSNAGLATRVRWRFSIRGRC